MKVLLPLTATLLAVLVSAAPLPTVYRCRDVHLASLDITTTQTQRHNIHLTRIIGWCTEIGFQPHSIHNFKQPAIKDVFPALLQQQQQTRLSAPQGHFQPKQQAMHVPPSQRRQRQRQRQRQPPSKNPLAPYDTHAATTAEPPLLSASDAHHYSSPVPATAAPRLPAKAPAHVYTHAEFSRDYRNSFIAHSSATTHDSFWSRAADFAMTVVLYAQYIPMDTLALCCMFFLIAVLLWDIAVEWVEQYRSILSCDCAHRGCELPCAAEGRDRYDSSDDDDKVLELEGVTAICSADSGRGAGVCLQGDEKMLYAHT